MKEGDRAGALGRRAGMTRVVRTQAASTPYEQWSTSPYQTAPSCATTSRGQADAEPFRWRSSYDPTAPAAG